MPSTRVRQNLTVIAFFAILSVAGLLWMAIQTGQRFGPLPPQFRLSFEVRDADGLVDGSNVRVAGIQVGRVLSVETTPNGSRVTMGLDRANDYDKVFTDATVLIRPKSLLGEKYVDMTRGSSNVLIPDGGSLPMSQAFTQVELDQVLNSSDEETRKALSVDLMSLGAGLKDRGADLNPTIPVLRNIAEHLSPVAARFKDRTAEIDHILVDTNMILTTLADDHAQLAQLLQGGDAVLGTVAQNDQHLAGLLNGASSTLARLNLAVSQQNNDQNIRTSIEQLPSLSNTLNQFLSVSTPAVNQLVPSFLLGKQYDYPDDQLTVSTSPGYGTDREWDSAFRIYDPGNSPVPGVVGLHGFLALAVQCGDTAAKYQCPGTYLKNGSGVPSSATSSSSPSTSLISGDDQALWAYLMGQ